jgi:peptidyl-prolyl cis-trans isomerase D
MMTYLRSQSRIFLAVILVVIGLSFLVFTNVPMAEHLKSSQRGRIAGQTVTTDEVQQAYMTVQLLRELSGRGSSSDENELMRDAWNRLIMLKSAEKMGLVAKESEVGEAYRRFFANEKGNFDPANVERFNQNFLSHKGIIPARFEEIMREEVLLRSLTRTITSPVRLDPGEAQEAVRKFLGPVKMNAVVFPTAAQASGVVIKPEDVEKEYKENANDPGYRTAELRQVEYVIFRLPAADQKKAGAEKEAALAKLREQAVNFAVEAIGGDAGASVDFAVLGSKYQVSAATTSWFAAMQAPAPLPPSPAFNRAAFKLTTNQPTSDVVEGDGVFYVLKLKEVKASELKPLAEVKASIEQKLRDKEAKRKALAVAQSTQEELLKNVKAGLTWKAATTQLKLKNEELPEFTPISLKQNRSPHVEIAAAVSRALSVGEISVPVPIDEGYIVLYLEKRGEPAAAELAQLGTRWEDDLIGRKRGLAMDAWLQDQYRRPENKIPAVVSNPDELAALRH